MTFIEDMVTISAIALTVGGLTLPVRDNLYWKICEHLYIGTAAGYTLIIALNSLQSNLINQLINGNAIYIVALVLSLMLYTRYFKSTRWMTRYPLAFVIAVGTAVSVRTVVDALIIKQIRSSIINPAAPIDAQIGTPATPLNNIIIIIIISSVLFYFIFWRTKVTENVFANQFRNLGISMLMLGFGIYMGNNLLSRTGRLAGRFDFLLTSENRLYTLFFVILGFASLIYAIRKEGTT